MTETRTAIVTGGSGGLGLAIARALLDRGDNVVLGGRDPHRLRAAVQHLDRPAAVRAYAGDIADPATAVALVNLAEETFGGIDILVNNAGAFASIPLLDTTPDQLDGYLTGNLRGTFLMTQAVAGAMIRRGAGGAIVNIGTVLVSHAIGGFPAAAALASKGGVHALTVALAAELAPHRIRVNEVAPGIVRTPLHAGIDVDALGALAVLDRIAEPDDIARSVLHLADAEFITGTTLNADGGFVTARA